MVAVYYKSFNPDFKSFDTYYNAYKAYKRDFSAYGVMLYDSYGNLLCCKTIGKDMRDIIIKEVVVRNLADLMDSD